MAPISSTAAIGVNPQIIDDPNLKLLLQNLNKFVPPQQQQQQQSEEGEKLLVDTNALVSTVEPYQSWTFEEQVLFNFCNAFGII